MFNYDIFKQFPRDTGVRYLFQLYLHSLLINEVKMAGMEVEYSGGGALIFSYLILIHQLDIFGGLSIAKLSRGSLIQVSSLAAALMACQ